MTFLHLNQKSRWILFLVLLLLVHFFALRNLILLSRDTLFGDFSFNALIPTPIYPPLRVPQSVTAFQYQAVNRLGADFTQIYFSARNISNLNNAYSEIDNLDPWNRASRIAPLVHYLCSVTICKLTYGPAALWHMLIQILSFYLVLYIGFVSLKLQEYFLPTLLFVNFCLFLTPVGLSWFERGQYSLYVASSYLFLLLGLIHKNYGWIILSALFAFIKWTSLPFIFVALAVYTLNFTKRENYHFGILAISIFVTVIILLSLPFIKETVLFVQGLINQEITRDPEDRSLALVFPRYWVKLVPLILVIIGFVLTRFFRGDFVRLLPFIVGADVLLLFAPTLAYDYSLPAILGLIPLMISWSRDLDADHHKFRIALLIALLLFIIAASFSLQLVGTRLALIIVYSTFAILMMAVPFFLPRKAISLAAGSR